MPTRDHLQSTYATVGVVPTQVDNSVALSMVGAYQNVTALNYGARPKPGVYVCKPTSMTKVLAYSIAMPEVKKRYSTSDYGLGGDLASWCAYIGGWTPKGTKITQGWDNSRSQEAINKAYAKVMSTDLEVGVMIGELRETFEGLANPLSALRKYFRNPRRISDRVETWEQTRKRLMRSGKDTLDAASGTWLEYRFSIMPLLKTIQDIYEHVNSQCSEFDGKMRKCRGKTTPKTSKTLIEVPYTGSRYYWTLKGTMTQKSWYTAKVAYRFTRPLTWQERYGLDALDIPAIAWELTRLSFMLDRFIHIGNWLSALKVASSAVNILGVAVTKRVETTVELEVIDVKFLGTVLEPVATGKTSYTLSSQAMERKCLAPGFNTVFPALNSQVWSLQKQIDALTLIWQNLPKKRR